MQNELLGGILQNIVMEKAVRDKIVKQQAEQREEEKRRRKAEQYDELDEFDDDEETKEIMRKMRAQRMRMAEEEPVKKKVEEKRTIGEYRQIKEDEFLSWVTKLKHTVVHFYHKEFERCKIMDKHLKILSQQFPNTQFLCIDAEKAPFFIQRLSIRTLPTLCIFINGVMKDKVLGFSGLSGDEFLTYELAAKLSESGVIECPKTKIKDKTILKGDRNRQGEQSGSDVDQ